MKPSQDCLDLIKVSEGLHRKRSNGDIESYLDPADIWTIGYGSIFHIDKKRAVKAGDIIDVATAERWLQIEVDEKANAVSGLCTVTLTQGMLDALVSFAFNVGIQAFEDSTLLRELNKGNYEEAARQFGRWIHGGGRVLPGLVIRRDREEALFRQDAFPGVTASVINTVFPTKPWEEPKLPLNIQRVLQQGDTGEDCYILNCALAELGYLSNGTQPGEYTAVTKDVVAWFQGDHDLQVDGLYGPKTNAALTGALTNARKRVPEPMADRVYCRLTRTKTSAYAGLERLLLEFVSPQGRVLDSLNVISGAPGRQSDESFRVPEDPLSFPGNLEPIPQARYTIGDIMWAGGKDNYTAEHAHESNGIGPVFVPLIKTQRDDRDAFGFHMDWNEKSGSPGSAGCVCVRTEPELRKLVDLLRRYDPRDLFVDWGIR